MLHDIGRHHGGGGGGRHGGGGGGHHHGGHHHGGHHHHHGGGGGYYRSPNYYYGGYVYPEYYTPPSCPFLYAPVLGSDGRIYDNECYARAAGANVVRVLKPGDSVQNPVAGLASSLPPWLDSDLKRKIIMGGIVVAAALGIRKLYRHF